MYLRLVTKLQTYKFFAKKTNLSTLSGFRQLRLEVIMLPLVLNTLSEGELVAHIDKYFFASIAKMGNWLS